MPANTPATAASAAIAVLDARTKGLEVAVNKVETDLGRLETSVLSAIQSMRDDFARDRKPQWGILIGAGSLLVTVMSAIGILAYMPIKAEMSALGVAQDRLALQTDRRLERIWEVTTPRTELDFRLKVFEQRFDDMQRQLGEVKQALDRRRRPVE